MSDGLSDAARGIFPPQSLEPRGKAQAEPGELTKVWRHAVHLGKQAYEAYRALNSIYPGDRPHARDQLLWKVCSELEEACDIIDCLSDENKVQVERIAELQKNETTYTECITDLLVALIKTGHLTMTQLEQAVKGEKP